MLPPTARRIDCSRSSRVGASSIAAASLKAEGDVVAKDRSWATVWAITDDARGWLAGSGARSNEIVGSRTLKSRDPTNCSLAWDVNVRVILELTKILWGRGMKSSECLPDFANGRRVPFCDCTLVYRRGDLCYKFNKTRN